jgi:sulfide:quinone oxidoreductase
VGAGAPPASGRGFRLGRRSSGANADFEGRFELERHDASNRTIEGADGRTLEYDLALVVPVHQASAVIRNAALVAEGGYMDVRLPSMISPQHDNVWGIGDVVAPTIGLGMAGVFAHFQAEHVATQIIDRARGTTWASSTTWSASA